MTETIARGIQPVAERALSDDVYLLAGILGNVIKSIAGKEAFDLEEDARNLAKNLRRG